MPKKMTWKEMKKNYPNEWLMIVDYETDKSGHITSGIVERHSYDKKSVYSPLSMNKDCAFKYTGESTFPGGWRAHAHYNQV